MTCDLILSRGFCHPFCSYQRSDFSLHNPIVIPAKAGIHYKLLDPVPLSSMGQAFNGMEIGDFVTSFVAISGQRSDFSLHNPIVIPAKAGIHYKLLDPVFQRDGDWGFLHPFGRNNQESRNNNQKIRNTKYKLTIGGQRADFSLHNPIVIPAKAGIHCKLLDPVFQRDGDWGFCHQFYAPSLCTFASL